MKDLKKYRRLPGILHRNKHFLTAYPVALSKAMQVFLRVDGVDKKTKEGAMVRHLRDARGGWWNVARDMFNLARAWR
jgi:electron transfer flavoprotein-quinone oxidoreductase